MVGKPDQLVHYYHKCILLSSTSSAKWFLIFSAGSRWKCCSVSFSCRWIDVFVWPNSYASTSWDHIMLFCLSVIQRGCTRLLLLSMVLRIFLKLCRIRRNIGSYDAQIRSTVISNVYVYVFWWDVLWVLVHKGVRWGLYSRIQFIIHVQSMVAYFAREERLTAGRNWAAVKRYNETSEQREERLAAQLQITRCQSPTKIPRKEKSAWEPSDNGSCQTNSGNKPGRGAPVVRAWRERAVLKRQRKIPLERVETDEAKLERTRTKSVGSHLWSSSEPKFAHFYITIVGWPRKSNADGRDGSGRDGGLQQVRGNLAPLPLVDRRSRIGTIFD